MFSVFIYFVIEILYCDNTDFQMTYRHNTVSGGVHYMVLGETLAFHLRAEYRAWGSIHHNYSWFSMRWPSLCVMTWLSCLNHLRNRTVCLDEIQVPYFEFLAVKSCLFFFLLLPVTQLYGVELFSHTVWLHNLIIFTSKYTW